MASLWGVKTLRLNAAAALRVGAGVRYIGDTESTGAAMTLDTPSYTIVDALVALDWDRWTLAVNATNLFDKTYYAPSSAFGDCFTGTRTLAVVSLCLRFCPRWAGASPKPGCC